MVDSGLLQGLGIDYNSPGGRGMLAQVLLEVAITTITPTIVWPQAKQGGNTPLLISRKLD